MPRVSNGARHTLRCGGLLRHPLRFLRWTGLLKYKPVSFETLNPVFWKTPPVFNAPPPRSAERQPWAASQPSGDLMNHVVTVDEGLATCYGYVFDRRGQLIEGATHKHREGRRYPEWMTRGDHIRPHSRFSRIHAYADQVAVLTASTQHLYFHWLLDVLPRIGMIADLVRSGCRLLADTRHRFQQATLSLLGIPPAQIIDASAVPVLTAPRLIIPCHQVMKGREIPDWALEFLKERFLPCNRPHPFPGVTKIYISRQATPTRKPTNESEIIERLQVHGFTAVELEKLSLPEQVSLFREVRVVVAPHGAGLANLVFSRPGVTVVELFPAANIDLYYRLCDALDLNYYFAKGRDGDPQCLTPANYYIAWQTIEKTLKMAEII